MRARRQVTELRADDLRFTAEEATVFLSQTMGLSLQPEAIEALEARTEGWIAGLQLAALSLQGRSPQAVKRFIAAFSGSNRYVVDYLVDEVLRQQPERLQTFLLRTSILARVSAPLASFVLTGESTAARDAASQATLEELDRRHVFVVALDDVRQWYRYHHLFGDALRQRLAAATPADQVAELHRRAAFWLEGQGWMQEAIDHLVQAQAHEEAGRLIARAGWALLGQGMPVLRAGSWLAALPDSVIQGNPRLCTLQAILAAGDTTVDEMEGWLHGAEAAVDAGGFEEDEQAIRGEIAALRTLAAALRGDAAQAVTSAEQALELLAPGDWVMQSIVLMSRGLAHLLQGDLQAAEQAYLSASALGRVRGNEGLALTAGGNLVYIERMRGALGAALVTGEDVLRWVNARADHAGEIVGPVLHATVADLLRERNDLEEALRHIIVARAPNAGPEFPEREVVRITSFVLARVLQARGELTEALAVANQAKELFRRYGDAWSVGVMEAFEAQVWVAQGNLPAAIHWHEHVRQAHERPHLGFSASFAVYEYEHLDVAPIQVLIAQGRSTFDAPALRRALDLTGETLTRARTMNLPWLQIKALVLRALAHDGLGEDAAIAVLGEALELAAPEGYRRVFLDEGAALGKLLRRAVTRNTTPDYVRDLLAAPPVR
jgi:LuxR family maltose regulon positive regulatory protein